MKKILLGSIIVLVSFIIIVLSLGLKTKNIYDTKDLIGKQISELDLKYLNEDRTFSTKNLKKNKFTLINFWASWCAPCRKEHKHLISLSKNKNIKIIGINFKDEKSKANKFIKEMGNPFDIIASDSDGKASVSFGVYGIPETILVNNDLVVIKKYIGPIDQKDVKKILKLVGQNE